MVHEDKLSSAALLAGLGRAMEALRSNEETLRELDAAIGDGDLGSTVARGATALSLKLPELLDRDVGTILIESGITFSKTAASTFGTLLAIALIAAGRAAQGKAAISLRDMAAMVRAAVGAVQEKGKARAGDKTFLDVLIPVSERLQEMARAGVGFRAALSSLAVTAKQALDSTAALEAKTGRASWFKERSVGVNDGGATAVYLMIEAFVDSCCGTAGKM